MFTIDLLNEQGIPLKTRPGGVVIVALTAVLPVLLAIGTLGFYLNNKIILSLKEREIGRVETGIEKFSDALEQRDALMREKIAYGSCLSEVSSSLKNYTQWSPILMTVIENMPESVVLTSLEVERKTVKKKVPDEDDPEDMKEIEVPARVLRLSVRGGPQCNCDEDVRDFQDHLRTSALLGPKLEENIRVSRDSQKIKDQDVFSYEITCVFKPRL
jgi:Tfp pilus assembly protein PilN